MTTDESFLTRRDALRNAALLVGGTLSASQLGLLSKAFAAMDANDAPRFLNAAQFATLSRVADLVIPETDTPGALGARVPQFIDMMLADWASVERQSRYVSGLADIDSRAGVAGFVALPNDAQLALLKDLEKKRFAREAEAAFFGELRKMLLFSYYATEIGATVELRFQPVPGDYQPCIPLTDESRTWFWSHYHVGL